MRARSIAAVAVPMRVSSGGGGVARLRLTQSPCVSCLRVAGLVIFIAIPNGEESGTDARVITCKFTGQRKNVRLFSDVFIYSFRFQPTRIIIVAVVAVCRVDSCYRLSGSARRATAVASSAGRVPRLRHRLHTG